MLYTLWPILCFLVQSAPWDKENEQWNTNIKPDEDPTKFEGAWPGHQYTPSPDDWRNLPVYQLLTDRFSDGDPTNSEFIPHYGGFDVRDFTHRHGGDFLGLIPKLDYLRGLGMRAVWISPIFQNGHNQYHQYAQHDFTLIDKRFGTLSDLRKLVTAAHSKGIYVLIDVVVNHMDNCYKFKGAHGLAEFKWHKDEYELELRNCQPKMNNTEQAYRDFHHNNEWVPDATYCPSPTYSMYSWGGEAKRDRCTGGSYGKSDFHHNGDLTSYYDAFITNFGKIYGIMDDLRTESTSVQQKHIAMTKALIASTDIDGFRIDTPMQVDLAFFKAWAPAVKAYAKTLGKNNFGLWGEFFVPTGRFTTMMGRGRVYEQWGKDEFIDDVATLNGGIEYNHWGYIMLKHYNTEDAFGYGDGSGSPDSGIGLKTEDRYNAKGLIHIHERFLTAADTYNPGTGRNENTMWRFCNNHDQWRQQARENGGGLGRFYTCMMWMTFWPGVPVHWAGDEQLFMTRGTALDGWAREELSVSAAWRAMGNVLPQKDNFDMTAPMYMYIQYLNSLKDYFFPKVFNCDTIVTKAIDDNAFYWERNCDQDVSMVFVFNYASKVVNVKGFSAPEKWKNSDVVNAIDGFYAPGEVGSVPGKTPTALTVGHENICDQMVCYKVDNDGKVDFQVQSFGRLLLVKMDDYSQFIRNLRDSQDGMKVMSVSPSHDAFVEARNSLEVKFTFCHALDVSKLAVTLHPGTVEKSTEAGTATTLRTDSSTSSATLTTSIEGDKLQPGVYELAVTALQKIIFRSRLRVGISSASPQDVTIDHFSNIHHGLIAEDFKKLKHVAVAATHWRARTSDVDSWTGWQELHPETWFNSKPAIPTVVQYYVPGSSAYFAVGCREQAGTACKASYQSEMYMRVGEWNAPGNPIKMTLDEDFTWKGTIEVKGVTEVWFMASSDHDRGKLGSMMKQEIQKSMDESKIWEGTRETSLLTMARWMKPVKVTGCCRLQPMDAEDTECCDMQGSQCQLALNDFTLKIQVINAPKLRDCNVFEALGKSPGWIYVIIAIVVLCICIGLGIALKARDTTPFVTMDTTESGVELNQRLDEAQAQESPVIRY
jgi:glycosidase